MRIETDRSDDEPYITIYTIEHGKQVFTEKQWYLYDTFSTTFHREDGPAIEDIKGNRSWWINGKRNREDGPAIEDFNGSKYWYTKDKLHREDGPAIEYTDGSKSWYLHGMPLESGDAYNAIIQSPDFLEVKAGTRYIGDLIYELSIKDPDQYSRWKEYSEFETKKDEIKEDNLTSSEYIGIFGEIVIIKNNNTTYYCKVPNKVIKIIKNKNTLTKIALKQKCKVIK